MEYFVIIESLKLIKFTYKGRKISALMGGFLSKDKSFCHWVAFDKNNLERIKENKCLDTSNLYLDVL